jgi:hypothetical protein
VNLFCEDGITGEEFDADEKAMHAAESGDALNPPDPDLGRGFASLSVPSEQVNGINGQRRVRLQQGPVQPDVPDRKPQYGFERAPQFADDLEAWLFPTVDESSSHELSAGCFSVKRTCEGARLM